jgi:hypothetical protein
MPPAEIRLHSYELAERGYAVKVAAITGEGNMKSAKLCALTMAAMTLSGCVTLTPEGQRNMCLAIERALTEPEALLENSNSPRDRFAASIALRYGLNGTPRDEARADAILGVLTAPHTSMMSYYVAGTKKMPGHMAFLPMTTYVLNPYEVQVVDNCLTLLTDPGEPPQAALDSGVCGGGENFRHLKELWVARAPH